MRTKTYTRLIRFYISRNLAIVVTETQKLNIAPRLEMRDIGQFSVRRESKTKERRRV